MFLITKLNGLIVNSDTSITTILSNDLNFTFFLGWCHFNTFCILKANLSWLVVVDDGDSRLCVLSNKFLVRIWIVELDEEIHIWLPVIVISDANIKSFCVLAVTKFNNTIKRFVVLVALSITIDGANTHSTSTSLFIYNCNS